MDDFRSSVSFVEELSEASAYAYSLGFEDCKEKVGRVFGLVGLDDLEPDEVLEEQPATPHSTDDGSTPTES